MCRDYRFAECFCIRFVKIRSGSYYVYQKQGDSECCLGYVIRRKEFPYWFFASYIDSYVATSGVTRIAAVRKSMENLIVKYPRYEKMPLFPKCDCMVGKVG